MRKHYIGLDMLRGLGVFTLIWMHSAFYYFNGLYDLDLNNPPPVVTIIGLLLMFAGIFAMISGVSHTFQFYRKLETQGYSNISLLKYNTVGGLIILAIAYAYFIFTGPGLVQMADRAMNNSILVDLIRNGLLHGFNMERILYVDSLVMIGINILLIGLVFLLVQKLAGSLPNGSYGKDGNISDDNNQYELEKVHKRAARIFLISGLGFFVISLLRIPLYGIYLDAVDQGNYGKVLLLNWLVNKNNPIMPYFSFSLLGGWIATLLVINNWKKILGNVLPVAIVLFIVGVFLYVKLPDTMLERSIDLKWFAIMTAQLGLFMMLLVATLGIFDFRKNKAQKRLPPIAKFIYRFGVAGLSIFFIESIASATIFRVINLFFPGTTFDLTGALLYGFCLAIIWGFILQAWEKKQYKYGLEYFYVHILRKFGSSTKEEKLKSGDI
ncbi:MAG: hypothetical protein WCF96_02495 [Eubacteriales bacterium]